jgi:putative transposase
MPRPPRVRDPDIAFHVTNRALGRRLAFESDIDRRFFLSLLAKAVRRHFLLVLAYSLMGTHFHLFVRSRIGDLADAMQFLLGDYTRGFNAHRERQGPLWGRRYFARPVRSPRYSQCVVRYLDFNPVKANLCRTPSEYPFGSAYHYARRNGPPWLDRAWVEP